MRKTCLICFSFFSAVVTSVGVGNAHAAADCGLSGSLDNRIAECGMSRCFKNNPDLTEVLCSSDQSFEWALVARLNQGEQGKIEIWADLTSRILWTDDLMIGGSNQDENSRFCSTNGNPAQTTGSFEENLKWAQQYRLGLELQFFLPTKFNFEGAVDRGIRKVSNIDGAVFWTSSSGERPGTFITFNNGEYRDMPSEAVDEYFRARCVARF